LNLAQRELDAMERTLKPTILARIGPARTQLSRQLAPAGLVLNRGELRPGHLKATKPRDA